MHEERKAQAEQDLDGQDDHAVDPGGPYRVVEQRVAEGTGVIAKSDQCPVVRADRLDEDQDERDGDDHEHCAQGRQEEQVREPFVPAQPAPTGPFRLRGVGGR